MIVPSVDLGAQYVSIQEDLDRAIQGVLGSGRFVLGPNVSALEQEISAFLGARQAIGVGSGTDALELSLLALGLGAGDEVIVPAFSFFATAEAVMRIGATPVFADILPDTYCMDPQDAARKVTPRTRALIPVHLYGHPADMRAIQALAYEHELSVVEDNAQACGARLGDVRTGSIGDLGCLSFYPTKNLGCFGDGGMVLTSDENLAERVQMLGNHGSRTKYLPEFAGTNSRLDEIQAAVLRVKLRHLERWNDRRLEVASIYLDQLSGLSATLPIIAENCSHVFNLFVIRVQEREAVRACLEAGGVASAVYYPVPLPFTAACRHLGYTVGSFPTAERTSREVLAIPMFPEITDGQVDQVVSAVRAALTR